MPAQYTLMCHIDPTWVKTWGGNNSSTKVCFGTAVNGNDPVVVAYAGPVAQDMTVQWIVEYSIAASKTAFQAGAPITAATDFVPISFGQKYTTDDTWVKGTPTDSPDAPPNGFLFQNVNTPAAVVIAKKINGQVKPFYISPTLLAPSGQTGGDKLIPTAKAFFWFRTDVDDGTMSEHDQTQKFMVNMDTSTKKIQYDANGVWSLVT